MNYEFEVSFELFKFGKGTLHLSTYLSIYLSKYLSINLSTYLYTYNNLDTYTFEQNAFPILLHFYEF
jgi:hypothetical protein